jgi:hypothetical protein
VCFDKACGDYVDAGSLERMIPGDYGFEIVEANRAAIEKRLTEYRRRLESKADHQERADILPDDAYRYAEIAGVRYRAD